MQVTVLVGKGAISIHAPTRGATVSPHRDDNNVGFQSTLPQGERRNRALMSHAMLYFNPRSHKGSDCIRFILRKIIKNFNPRSHKGSDAIRQRNFYIYVISIHAPTRGATAIFPNFRPCITLNIPKFYQYHSFFLIICS